MTTKPMFDLEMTGMEKDAIISPCGHYRYFLSRRWGHANTPLVWVMLNPSIADARIDDQTVKKCIGFSTIFGFRALHILNLFAYRSKVQSGLLEVADPIGPENDDHLKAMITPKSLVICAWGKPGKLGDRDQKVMASFIVRGIKPYCLGINSDRTPRHPLMIGYKTPMQKFGW